MSKFNYKPKIISQIPINNQSTKNKKRASSQIKYQKAPDIMTQAKPAYLNNFVRPINPHQSAFTPTNRSKNLEQKNLLLPQKSLEFSDKKTLILDLDETLVHSSFVPFENNDIILNVDFESVMYNIYVLVRPGAEEFIKKVSKLYEVIIFTASIAKYALPLLDILDNEKKIKYRLTREHCTFLNGIYIKELKRLNRNLKDLIILDNSPLAYAFDSDNGLPIKAWYEDKGDKELDKIFPILEFLSNTKDVRPFINKFVSNNEIIFETANDLINKVQDQNINNINIGINRTNDNKEDSEKKAISVNVNINIKNKINNDKDNIFINNKENKIINKLPYKEYKNNLNNTNTIKRNNNDKANNNNNNYIIKFINDKKDISYKNNITNYNLNKNNSKTGKNKNIIENKKNNKEKISNTKTNILLQKKKNSFRTGQKLGEKISFKNTSTSNNIYLKNNHNHNNYFINNTKYPLNNNDNDFLLGFSLSNTTKNKVSEKARLNPNNKEKSGIYNNSKNKEQYLLQNNIIYDKNNTLNTNYINKKYKYTNLLEQLEKKTIKTNCSLNNKSQNISKSTKLFNGKNMLQKKKFNNHNKNKKYNHNRVSSSLIGKYQALIINNSLSDNKVNTNSHVSRSKSTGNFINFTKKFQKPKTPKGQFLFEKKIMVGVSKEISKYNKKAINKSNGFSKTTRHLNNHQIIISDENKNYNYL